MKKVNKIPFSQLIYFFILIILIILRIASLNNLQWYINIVNYVSMVVSVSAIWSSTINKSIQNRQKNICKVIFVGVLLLLIVPLIFITIFSINIPGILNDIFTLAALLFCICNVIFEYIIKRIFSLIYKNE